MRQNFLWAQANTFFLELGRGPLGQKVAKNAFLAPIWGTLGLWFI